MVDLEVRAITLKVRRRLMGAKVKRFWDASWATGCAAMPAIISFSKG